MAAGRLPAAMGQQWPGALPPPPEPAAPEPLKPPSRDRNTLSSSSGFSFQRADCRPCCRAEWCKEGSCGSEGFGKRLAAELENKPPFGPRLISASALSSAASTLSRTEEVAALALRSVRDQETPTGGVFSGTVNPTGQPQGEGVQRYPDGATYSGQWDQGEAHGSGELRLADKTLVYRGEWKAGLRHGQGVEHCVENGAEYCGAFECGVKEGRGTLQWPSSAAYVGDFHKGKFHGEGELQWADSRVYAGQWRSGCMHGVGQFKWPDGRRFTGHYQEHTMHGPGVYTWPDGSVCKGRWEQGKMHGSGTHIDPEGRSRHGRWEWGVLAYWTD